MSSAILAPSLCCARTDGRTDMRANATTPTKNQPVFMFRASPADLDARWRRGASDRPSRSAYSLCFLCRRIVEDTARIGEGLVAAAPSTLTAPHGLARQPHGGAPAA